MINRQNIVQNAHGIVAAAAIKAAEVVTVNSANKVIKYAGSGMPLGVAENNAAIGDVVEISTHQVKIRVSTIVAIGNVVWSTAAGVIAGGATAPTGARVLGTAITACAANGVCVIYWDPASATVPA